MPRARRLSADEVVRALGAFGFTPADQRGSHIKLRRVVSAGQVQTLTIPNHRQLEVGTQAAIFRQACRYVVEAELRPYFFTE